MSGSYKCRKCGKKHSEKEYRQNNFCHQCGTFIPDPDQQTTPANLIPDVEQAIKMGRTRQDDFQRTDRLSKYIVSDYSDYFEPYSLEQALLLYLRNFPR